VRPALSVILLTTLIGAGQGLVLALFALDLASRVQVLESVRELVIAGSAVAVALLIAGLVASFFHLGRPERAWRAATQWRTSWLSREVILLPALIAATAACGIAHHVDFDSALWLGGLSALLAVVLFVCTGMIYACLKFLQEWHTPWTLVNFTVFGAISGTLCATSLAARFAPAATPALGAASVALLLAGAACWGMHSRRNRRLRSRSSLQTAIGIKHPQIRQLAQGFSAGSFNTREFFHGGTPELLARMRTCACGLGFVAPAVLAIAASMQLVLLWDLAFIAHMLGMGCERWRFFAEARHPQNLYYQRAS